MLFIYICFLLHICVAENVSTADIQAVTELVQPDLTRNVLEEHTDLTRNVLDEHRDVADTIVRNVTEIVPTVAIRDGLAGVSENTTVGVVQNETFKLPQELYDICLYSQVSHQKVIDVSMLNI